MNGIFYTIAIHLHTHTKTLHAQYLQMRTLERQGYPVFISSPVFQVVNQFSDYILPMHCCVVHGRSIRPSHPTTPICMHHVVLPCHIFIPPSVPGCLSIFRLCNIHELPCGIWKAFISNDTNSQLQLSQIFKMSVHPSFDFAPYALSHFRSTLSPDVSPSVRNCWTHPAGRRVLCNQLRLSFCPSVTKVLILPAISFF